MSALSNIEVSTCVCVFFSALQLLCSGSLFHLLMPGPIIFSLHYTVSFRYVFFYQENVVSSCSFSEFCVQPCIPLSPYTHSFATGLTQTGHPVSGSCFELQQNTLYKLEMSVRAQT